MTTRQQILEALQVLFDVEHIEDDCYRVRESELLGWEGPRVGAFGKACEILRKFKEELLDSTKS